MDQDVTRSDAWNCVQRAEVQKALSESNAYSQTGITYNPPGHFYDSTAEDQTVGGDNEIQLDNYPIPQSEHIQMLNVTGWSATRLIPSSLIPKSE